jgi:hypothetical protein
MVQPNGVFITFDVWAKRYQPDSMMLLVVCEETQVVVLR